MLKLNNLSRTRKSIFIILAIIIAFITWLVIRLATTDTHLNLVSLYKLPEFTSLKNSYSLFSDDYAIAVDGKVITGQSYDNGENKILPTASTTKMILALAIMREKPFELGQSGETITISEEDYDSYIWYYTHNGSTTAVQVGEEISEHDALMSLMLASSNNMADTLAKWAFGSIENYRTYATNMLTEWGIANTTLGEDASGYSETTTSTAADLAVIGAKVLENPVLAEIVNTKSYTVPVAGAIENSNKLLGINDIIGVKTGYIGDISGYCLVSGYKEEDHIITVALLKAPTREVSFSESLAIINSLQQTAKITKLVNQEQIVGYYDSWWTGTVAIKADADFSELAFKEAEIDHNLEMSGHEGALNIAINGKTYEARVSADSYEDSPSLIDRIKHIFGWQKEKTEIVAEPAKEGTTSTEPSTENTEEALDIVDEKFTYAPSSNCTINFGKLMLINPNFTVEDSFISARRDELVSISSLYGIVEGNAYNGDNLLDSEAAAHINDMINAYKAEYPGHTIETRSCFRSVGTKCGRLCAATGASDHHTGLTCDLLDPVYGTSLDTDDYQEHIEWQWLKANSYKYGFIDRFPEAWAGGPMSEPLNVDENGSTGLYETWHYRYVGIDAATEIATGKYNNGEYDSLEHYLKAKGLITDLKNAKCK